MSRQCRICLHLKDETEFASNGRKFAVENRCKKCVNRAATILRKLKKTSPPKPKNCECCKNEDNRLCLDHCHDTLEFRGWICEPCNRGIGQLGDNIKGLQKAMSYLQRTTKEKEINH